MCTEQDELRTEQSKFIRDEIWILTFGGGFQRAGVYSKNTNVSEKDRKEFRRGIRNRIESIVHDKYETTEVSSADHIKTLLELKAWIDSNYSDILAKNEITLGVVQKLLNLYLKYQWCLDVVRMPPHCPFDRIIISEMELDGGPIPWTQLNSVNDYKELVKTASEKADEDDLTIAEWELNVFIRK